MTFLGYPLPVTQYQITRAYAPYKNSLDRKQKQDNEVAWWFKQDLKTYFSSKNTGNMDVLYFCTPVVGDEFVALILRDVQLALASCVLVFLWIWGQTGSLFIAIAGIFEIVFSLPLAFMVYRLILQFEYFSSLNPLCVYVIMAVGADDIFVFMDAWKQSAYQGPAVLEDLETRMTWVYERAGKERKKQGKYAN